MDLVDIAQAVRRQWRVAVVVLLLTLAATVLVVLSLGSRYEAVASLLLVGPEIVGVDPDESGVGEPPILTPGIVAEIVEGDVTRSNLDVPGEPAEYDVIISADGTTMRVEAIAPTAASVVPTAAAVVEAIEDIVAGSTDRAEGQADSEVTFRVLSRPAEARERTVVGEDGESRVEYVAVGSVLLLTPEPSSQQANPYTPSLGTVRVLQEVASSEAARTSILADYEGADFTVESQPRDTAPVIYVTATASNTTGTLDVLQAAITALDEDLAERQALTGAPQTSWLRLQRLYVPEVPTSLSGSLIRPVVTIVGLGLVAAVSLAVLIDSLLSARSRRREAEWAEREEAAYDGSVRGRASSHVKQVS